MALEAKTLGQDTQQQAQASTGQQQEVSDSNAAPAVASQTASRPEWLPESYFDAEKGETKWDDFGKHYSEIAAAHKAEADRLAAFPQKIEDLEIPLPEGAKLPEGVKLDANDPTFSAFRQFVFDKKIDPAVAGELLGMEVKSRLSEVEMINKRVDEEAAKLGPNSSARITAVRTAFEGRFGKPVGEAIMSGVFRADQVQALEKVVLALSNGTAGDVSGGQREQKSEEISDEDYAKMSPRERLEYARTKAAS